MRCTAAAAPTGQPITDDHQQSFSRVAELYHNQDPSRLQTYRQRADELRNRFCVEHRQALVAALRPFLEEIHAPRSAMAQLERLANPDSVVVVAGQQAGLFTGPLYSLYKALSAIGLARRLEQELQRPVVPVFWIASEDHDWGEVDHAYVLDDQDGVRRLRIPEAPELHRMVHHFPLPQTAVAGVLRELEEVLPSGPWRTEVLAAVHDTWQPGDTLAVWFARLLYRMLGETGLVLLDPCLPGLRQLARGVWAAVLQQQGELAARLTERYRAVEARGYHPAVVFDPVNTTLFHVAAGRRYVLERTDDPNRLRVRGLGMERSVAEWVATAEADPTAFSSNVLLRPVVQDFLLPTVAFVGGPSEIAYHALAGAVFETLQRTMPPLVLRDRLTVFVPSVLRNMEKWGLSRDAVLSLSGLRDQGARAFGALDLDAACERMSAESRARWDAWAQSWAHLGPQVARLAETQVRREQAGIARTTAKAKFLLQQAHDVEVRQLRHIERWIWVDGHPQERRLCPLNLWAQHGLDWLRDLPLWGQYDRPGTHYYVDLA
ncbi:MAG: bacillithiol biosynthesis cysteine-adding enzyme BshC [Alicyclobacillus sp.]|nr:bacillithiol biosynthesis cysteine-adding enzyme BshC [Alicyclobacillus sp.]